MPVLWLITNWQTIAKIILKAFRYYRKQVTEKYFGVYMFIAAALIILYSVLCNLRKRVSRVLPKLKQKQAAAYEKVLQWESMKKRPLKVQLLRIKHGLHFALKLIVSPIQGFWDLKYEKRGNLPTAMVLLALLIISYLVNYQYSGFIFNTRDPRTLNIVSESISILVPIIMWAAINWSLTTLMNGKGSFKEILIATSYSVHSADFGSCTFNNYQQLSNHG